jgi:plasmid stability protein
MYANEDFAMATIMIRNLDETTKTNLRLQAARHGISMEEEARQLLRKAVNPAAPSGGLGTRLQRRFSTLGGVDLETVRLPDRSLPDFTEADEQ